MRYGQIMYKILSFLLTSFFLVLSTNASIVMPEEQLYFSKRARSVNLMVKNYFNYPIEYGVRLGEQSSKDFKLFPKKIKIMPEGGIRFMFKYVAKDTANEYCEMILLEQIDSIPTRAESPSKQSSPQQIKAAIRTLVNFSLPLCVFKSERNIDRDFAINKVTIEQNQISVMLTKKHKNIVIGKILITSSEESIAERLFLLKPEETEKNIIALISPKIPNNFTMEVNSIDLSGKVLNHHIYNQK
jgi:hypothetical protein